MCLPCKAALGFTGLSFLEGPSKDCTKLPKATKQNWLPARVCSSWLFVLRSRPCSPEGGVKTPAVKPCIVYIIVLLCSVGSKQCQQLTGFSPIGYCTQLLADLWNYIFFLIMIGYWIFFDGDDGAVDVGIPRFQPMPGSSPWASGHRCGFWGPHIIDVGYKLHAGYQPFTDLHHFTSISQLKV